MAPGDGEEHRMSAPLSALRRDRHRKMSDASSGANRLRIKMRPNGEKISVPLCALTRE